MTYDFSNLEDTIKGAREWLVSEYQGIRTGRAAPALLDAIRVNAYGSVVSLKQTANIAVEDARTLRVLPWDTSLVKEVEKAISSADLGVGISSDEQGVRVTFPELTSDRRKELLRLAKQKLEDARKTTRAARDEEWNKIQKREREGVMTEDDKFLFKDKLQEKVDEANNAFDEIFTQKEREISA